MKKFLVIFLSVSLCFTLGACNGSSTNNTDDSETQNVQPSTNLTPTEENILESETQNVQPSTDLIPTEENILEIEGEKFSLPIPAKTLLDYGWEIPEHARNEKLGAKKGALYFFPLYKNSQAKIGNVAFYNHSDSEKTLENCDITTLKLIGLSNYDNEYQCSFTISGVITENSTYEEVLALYGTEEEPKEGYKIRDDYGTASQNAEAFEKYGFKVNIYGKYSDGVHPYNYTFNFNADKTINSVEIESTDYQLSALSTSKLS